MLNIQLNNQEGKHQCYGKVVGEWVIFRCPHCPDFERKIHKKTGDMKSKRHHENMIGHYGTFMPPGMDYPFSTPN